jgi:DNA-binding CsgD family transcriptional regulator
MIIFFFTVLMSFSLLLGIYILILYPKDRLNIVFFILTLLLTMQCLFAVMVQTPVVYTHNNYLQLCAHAGSLTFSFYVFFLMIFYLLLTKIIKVNWYIVILVLLLPVYMSIRILMYKGNLIEFSLHNNIVITTQYPDFYDQYNLFIILYLLAMTLLVVVWLKTTKEKKCKRQATILLVTQILIIIMTQLDQYILFHITHIYKYRIPGVYAIYFAVWILGVWYAMVKYRFMAVSSSIVNKDILTNIDECVILLNASHKIITTNSKILDLFGHHRNYSNMHIAGLIDHYERITGELEDLKLGRYHDFACRLNFISENNHPLFMEVKFKSIRDQYDDFLGVLMIAREIEDAKRLRDLYKISAREVTVIQSIIQGKTNRQIADDLTISAKTVKSHITHIFNKLGVDNKVQLIILLKEFHLIPEQKADKLLFSKS